MPKYVEPVKALTKCSGNLFIKFYEQSVLLKDGSCHLLFFQEYVVTKTNDGSDYHQEKKNANKCITMPYSQPCAN